MSKSTQTPTVVLTPAEVMERDLLNLVAKCNARKVRAGGKVAK